MVQKAERSLIYPKIAIVGVAGAGKTYSALRFARGYVGETGRVAVLDTENGSAGIYADVTDFDVQEIKPAVIRGVGNTKQRIFNTEDFVTGIEEACQEKYDALIIDSASQVWNTVLELKANIDYNGGNQFTNWKIPKEKLARVKTAILQSPIMIVCCFRSKIEYVLEKDEKGSTTPKRVGMAPVASGDAEYDYSIVFDVNKQHESSILKSRCPIFGNDFKEVLEETHGQEFRKWIGK